VYYLIKIAITSALIIAISEIAKRSSVIGALLASLPIISLIAIIWLYVETKDVGKVSALTTSIFWLVLPSLVLFVSLPVLLKQGLDFYISIAISVGLTAIAYYLLYVVLSRYGVKL
jgi:hypothetical protein